jgi:hypothetical protein
VTFRDRLLETLRAVESVLQVEGVMVIGSEVPNLLQAEAASTLVVSQDVDIGVPVSRLAEVKRCVAGLAAFRPAAEEPSVRVPVDPRLIEVNFLGIDPAITRAAETYVLEDPELPLLVFGTLSHLRPAPPAEIAGVRMVLPRPAGLVLEKLLTDRSGVKGERDLLVALALLMIADSGDLDELTRQYRGLSAELRYTVRANLALLSLLRPVAGMPDPRPERARIAVLLQRLDREEAGR